MGVPSHFTSGAYFSPTLIADVLIPGKPMRLRPDYIAAAFCGSSTQAAFVSAHSPSHSPSCTPVPVLYPVCRSRRSSSSLFSAIPLPPLAYPPQCTYPLFPLLPLHPPSFALPFPTPDYDHSRYATPVRTPDTMRTVDPMRSVDVGVPRRPRRPRRLLSHLDHLSLMPIHPPLTATHPQCLFPILPHPVFTFSYATSNFRAIPPPLEASACHAPPTLHALPATCTTAAAAMPSSSPPHAHRQSAARSRSHHLTHAPGPIPSMPYTTAGVPGRADDHSPSHTPPSSFSACLHHLQRTLIWPDYLQHAPYLQQPFTIALAAFIASSTPASSRIPLDRRYRT
ncbi:hypothetical protein B0H13DRAFT_2383342 [Mycena leptocephala]|nr:hypothetical protein B0H13DRAFT_2383342 [Mycena leptocephala]